jgi:hypothetical protein
MFGGIEVRVFSFLFLLLVQLTASVLGCPKTCFCNMLSKIVYCSRKDLKEIPIGIPRDARQLNLNSNNFEVATLERHNFSSFGHLEHLYLSDCGIRAIEVGTFIDLVNLKWLDLSKNRIKDIQDFTFRGLSLEQLFLNGNDGLVMHRDTFNGLKAQGLYLHQCGLKEISLQVFRPINDSLKNLWLNDNNIRRIGREMQYIFTSLSHLRLHTNPLHCNCKMSWLKQYYDNHLGVFEGAPAPSCASPSHAHNRGFNSLSPRDFRCQPPIFNDVDLLFANENGILSCSASGDPAPTLYWIRPSGERNAYPPPQDENAVRTDGVMKIAHVEGIYTGSYECLATNAGGNVTLTLNVSWPRIEKQTVIKYIQPPPPKTEKPTTTEDGVDDKPSRNAEKETTGVILQHNNENLIETKTFSMIELVGAVLGTFVLTLIVCVIVFHLMYRLRAGKVPRNRLENGYKPKENVYLDRVTDEEAYMYKENYSRR